MQLVLKLESTPSTTVPSQKRAWISDRQSMTIGRAGGDFALPPDGQVSGKHFRITCDGKQCLIEDLKSSNGTFLNDVRVKQARLRDGDQIRIGKTTFSVQITGQAPAETDEADSGPDMLRASSSLQLPGDEPPAKLERGEPIRFFNSTPYQFAMIPGRVRFPGHSITLIVKGSFDLQPGTPATVAKEQAPVLGDVLYDDAEHEMAAPRYEEDVACFKPKADLLLAGACYPPGGQEATKCEVEFRVGQVARRLVVHGDRRWQGILGGEASAPRPFQKMPLRYERSYGGEGYAKNPTGIGHVKIDATDPGRTKLPLPNIEDPQRQMQLRVDKPEPACFGPLGKQWEQRRRHLGTYDEAWVKERWPWFASNFNWAYCNAAPEAQQCAYLRGDEEVYLENLHPERPKQTSRLPGRRVRCFLYEVQGEERKFREVTMHLDTLWIDAEASQLTLVWRGVAAVPTAELDDLRSVFFMEEPVAAPLPLRECLLAFRKARSDWEAEWASEEAATPTEVDVAAGPPPTIVVAPAEEEAQAPPDPLELEMAAIHAKVTADLRATIIAAGGDPDNPPVPTDAEKREAYALLRSLGIQTPDDEPPLAPTPWTRERVAERVAAGESLEGEELQGLDLSNLNLAGANFTGASLEGANLSGADLTDAICAEANLNQARLVGARLTRANFREATLSAADLTQAAGEGAVFSGARLLAADLTQVDLPAAMLQDAQLAGAKAQRAKLALALLAGAKLAGSQLTEADLREADLTGADLSSAHLGHALLKNAVLISADLAGANLEAVQAAGALFTGGKLNDARLSQGSFVGADFSKARLHRASFEKADLTEATFEEADARQANFTRANLTGLRAAQGRFSNARFREVQAGGAVWTGGALAAADFFRAQAPKCDFSKANLERASFAAAELRESRFEEASLRHANLRQLNLFQGSLAKADLTEADFSEANLYGVDFAETVLDRAKSDGANLKLSRLANSKG